MDRFYPPVSVSTSGSRPDNPPIPSFALTFPSANCASCLTNTAFRAGFHCIMPRCLRRSVRLLPLLPDFSGELVIVESVSSVELVLLLEADPLEVVGSFAGAESLEGIDPLPGGVRGGDDGGGGAGGGC